MCRGEGGSGAFYDPREITKIDYLSLSSKEKVFFPFFTSSLSPDEPGAEYFSGIKLLSVGIGETPIKSLSSGFTGLIFVLSISCLVIVTKFSPMMAPSFWRYVVREHFPALSVVPVAGWGS